MRILCVFVLFVLAWIALGGAMTAIAGPLKPRGEFVDIGGGRTMRIVCAGPAHTDQPLVVMEAGAFGFSADWGAIQDRLSQKSVRSCAYDRAGMGWSDPGPKPRDAVAIASDLEKLLAAKGETGPLILMGHSMAGLNVRVFAARNPERVKGLVLIEAAVPESNDSPQVQHFVRLFVNLSNMGAVAASLGLFKPISSIGEHIGLPPDAAREKRRAFASGKHNRTAADEVRLWNRSAAEAASSAPYDPDWPVAVILAGDANAPRNVSRALPATKARRGYVEGVIGASHANVLGYAHNDAVLRGMDFVLANLK